MRGSEEFFSSERKKRAPSASPRTWEKGGGICGGGGVPFPLGGVLSQEHMRKELEGEKMGFLRAKGQVVRGEEVAIL